MQHVLDGFFEEGKENEGGYGHVKSLGPDEEARIEAILSQVGHFADNIDLLPVAGHAFKGIFIYFQRLHQHTRSFPPLECACIVKPIMTCVSWNQ